MRTVASLVGAGLVLFALGYLAVAVFAFPGGRGDPIVAVPELRGRTLPAARRVAERAVLRVERGSTLNHPRVRRGAVLAQSPLPGEEVTRGTTVRVILSEGPLRRSVPAVDALPAAQASKLLRQIGFRVSVLQQPDERPAGRVLGVRPAAGTVLSIPDSVVLVISSGPPMITVPSLAGLPPSVAADALRNAGLRLGPADYDPFATAPLGEVVAQRPGAGASMQSGSAVGITVSGSPPGPTAAPDTGSAAPPSAPPVPPPPGRDDSGD